ncbi:unnamed protein product [Clonostachys byssicola]|uniref:Uncharacterized protein n=1 Tax=Clonostachys byssicola TaxID=160290 RepID=A0A9N9XZD3_9HYPO|nr:unnamed protein product [Clonostachys byssicola]
MAESGNRMDSSKSNETASAAAQPSVSEESKSEIDPTVYTHHRNLSKPLIDKWDAIYAQVEKENAEMTDEQIMEKYPFMKNLGPST